MPLRRYGDNHGWVICSPSNLTALQAVRAAVKWAHKPVGRNAVRQRANHQAITLVGGTRIADGKRIHSAQQRSEIGFHRGPTLANAVYGGTAAEIQAEFALFGRQRLHRQPAQPQRELAAAGSIVWLRCQLLAEARRLQSSRWSWWLSHWPDLMVWQSLERREPEASLWRRGRPSSQPLAQLPVF